MTRNPNSGLQRPRTQTRDLRMKLIQRLPDMLDAAIAAYQRIALGSQSEDPKSFVATHSGAKAALAHIEQIIKLAEAALDDGPDAVLADQSEVETYLSVARQALIGDPTAGEEDR